MKVTYSVRCHKGNVRKKNEDNFFADGNTLLSEYCDKPFSIDASTFSPIVLAVCDGMGGEESGEFASFTASQLLLQARLQIQTELNCAVRNYIEAVNKEINSSGKRSGTTLALAVITKKGAYCFNVGDSRIYLMKRGSFRRITNDHTKSADKIKSSGISAQNTRQYDGGNRLTRCIGIGNYRSAENYPVIGGKCRLLICSDGLTDMVGDEDIKKIMSENMRTPAVAEGLLRTALKNGGRDNITVIVADVTHNFF